MSYLKLMVIFAVKSKRMIRLETIFTKSKMAKSADKFQEGCEIMTSVAQIMLVISFVARGQSPNME